MKTKHRETRTMKKAEKDKMVTAGAGTKTAATKGV